MNKSNIYKLKISNFYDFKIRARFLLVDIFIGLHNVMSQFVKKYGNF